MKEEKVILPWSNDSLKADQKYISSVCGHRLGNRVRSPRNELNYTLKLRAMFYAHGCKL